MDQQLDQYKEIAQKLWNKFQNWLFPGIPMIHARALLVLGLIALWQNLKALLSIKDLVLFDFGVEPLVTAFFMVQMVIPLLAVVGVFLLFRSKIWGWVLFVTFVLNQVFQNLLSLWYSRFWESRQQYADSGILEDLDNLLGYNPRESFIQLIVYALVAGYLCSKPVRTLYHINLKKHAGIAAGIILLIYLLTMLLNT
jgi:hypothetical protein